MKHTNYPCRKCIYLGLAKDSYEFKINRDDVFRKQARAIEMGFKGLADWKNIQNFMEDAYATNN